MKLVNTLSCAFTRSSNLLQLASADINKLKSSQINLQQELLVTKEKVLVSQTEQLDAVTSTVKTEIKTFADVLGSSSNASLTTTKVKDVVKSAVLEEERMHNVMMYGVSESTGENIARANQNEQRQVQEIMTEIGVADHQLRNVSFERIGDAKEDGTRPIRVQFQRKADVLDVLSRSRDLKDSESYSRVFLGPDRTLEERKAHRKLVEELKKKRIECPDMIFYIKNNAIRSKRRTSQES